MRRRKKNGYEYTSTSDEDMNNVMAMIWKLKVMMMVICRHLAFFCVVKSSWYGIKVRIKLLVIFIPLCDSFMLIKM